jgi:FKBP-type peptidyl-prolyl cis-trans isomerase SlpA
VVAATDHEVTVDFSHPLAGRDLIFDVEIISVEP